MDKSYSKDNSSYRQDYSDIQDDDGSFRTQLLESKMIRKKAEEDAQLLANRIALLQLEEKKAMKKIEETKKKAKEIIELKNRNLQSQKEREHMKKQKEEEEIKKLIQNKSVKEQVKINQENNRNQLLRRLKDDVELMRKTKQDMKEQTLSQKDEDYMKNVEVVNSIKNKEREAQIKKQRQLEEVKQRARIEYENKINQELLLKDKTDDLIARLEQQEMELIQRLQNTQTLQKEAFDDLEKALSVVPGRE